MTRQSLFIYSLIFAFLIISNSCEKPNETYPEVVITHPIEGSSYSYGDTIFVTAKIADSDGRYVLNVSQNGVGLGLASRKVSSSGDAHQFEIYYTNKDVSGGACEIKLTAYNGENRSSDFLKIYLTELPLEYLGWVALAESAGSSELTFSKSNNQKQTINLAGDFHYLAQFDDGQGVMAAPSMTGKIGGFGINPFQKIFETDLPVTTGSPLYNELIPAGNRVYALAENGEVRSFDAAGNVKSYWVLNSDEIAVSGCSVDDRLMMCVKERGKENYFLQLRAANNGALLKNKAIEGRAKEVVGVEATVFFALIEKNGSTQLVKYEAGNNTLTELFTLSGKPQSALLLPDEKMLISTDDEIHLFNTDTEAYPSVLFNFGAVDMAYNKLNNRVVLCTENEINEATLQGSYTTIYFSSKPLYQIELLFNK